MLTALLRKASSAGFGVFAFAALMAPANASVIYEAGGPTTRIVGPRSSDTIPITYAGRLEVTDAAVAAGVATLADIISFEIDFGGVQATLADLDTAIFDTFAIQFSGDRTAVSAMSSRATAPTLLPGLGGVAIGDFVPGWVFAVSDVLAVPLPAASIFFQAGAPLLMTLDADVAAIGDGPLTRSAESGPTLAVVSAPSPVPLLFVGLMVLVAMSWCTARGTRP